MDLSVNNIRKRLAAKFLPVAVKRRFCSGLYYALLAPRFDREQQAVLAGQKKFQESNGPGGGTSTKLRRNIHRLEKGLIMRPRRAVFALEYIEETVKAYQRAVAEANDAADTTNGEMNWAGDVLTDYFEACEPHPLIDRLRGDFEKLSKPAFEAMATRSDRFRPYVRDLSSVPSVDYEQLLGLAVRRRSVRWFLNKSVPRELVEKAVQIASLSPSACNRQPFEFRFFDEPEHLSRVAALPGGTKGFHEQFPLVGVVIGSLAHYYDERDRHVIYIDGGLATMSLVYALETLGLSSCCINWPDLESAELEAAKVLGLRDYERPVMFLAIGFPDPEGKVPYSEKKSVSQLCHWNYFG